MPWPASRSPSTPPSSAAEAPASPASSVPGSSAPAPEQVWPSRPSPDDAAYSWGPRLWKKLPLPVATALGPHIVRGIP